MTRHAFKGLGLAATPYRQTCHAPLVTGDEAVTVTSLFENKP